MDTTQHVTLIPCIREGLFERPMVAQKEVVVLLSLRSRRWRVKECRCILPLADVSNHRPTIMSPPDRLDIDSFSQHHRPPLISSTTFPTSRSRPTLVVEHNVCVHRCSLASVGGVSSYPLLRSGNLCWCCWRRLPRSSATIEAGSLSAKDSS